MRRHKRHKRFWQTWTDEQSDGEGARGSRQDHRRAWREHFSEFFGVMPEKHWIFGGRRFKPWSSGSWGTPGLFNPFVAMLLSKGGGLLSLYVLHLLEEKPRYGNDIMREIEERTQGHWSPNPGAIYPLLNAMEESGLVTGEWEDPDKRTRRIYYLTPAGRQELARLKEVMRPKIEETIGVLRDMCDDLEIDEED